MNIIETVLKLLGSGDTISKLGAMLGIGQQRAGRAVSVAVPAILARLAGAASKPGGGTEIANAVGQQDPGILNNLSGLLSGGSGAAAAQGSGLLGSLLGVSGMSQIGSVLSCFTGVGEGGMGKLLGLLAPMVMGAIAKQAMGLDGAGIASMQAGQLGNIAATLPAGLERMGAVGKT